VNRAENDAENVTIDVAGLKNMKPSAITMTLSGITGETFESDAVNALKAGEAQVTGTKVSLTVPAKSITAVILSADAVAGIAPASVAANLLSSQGNVWFVNNSAGNIRSVQVFTSLGQEVRNMNELSRGNVSLQTEKLVRGNYIILIHSTSGSQIQPISVK